MQAGERVGVYEIRDLVAGGGQAEVFRAWNSGLGRMEAMKIPLSHLARDPSFVARFRRGARIAANLQHPHIIQIFNVSEENSPQLFFTMELIEGGDLFTHLRRARLAPAQCLGILREVADALDFAHARGVIHRDIKPANIMLDERGVKVVDFEIARAALDDDGTQLTQSGMFLGSLPYMSPEQAGSNETVGAASDQYALGVVAYEMLCGRPPFTASQGTNPASLLIKHLQTPPPAPSLFNADLPPAAEAVLLRALAKTTRERFSSCREFIEQLELAFQAPDTAKYSVARDEYSDEKTATREKTTSQPRSKTFNRVGPAAVVAACAGIALIGWKLHTEHSSSPPTPVVKSISPSIFKLPTPTVPAATAAFANQQRAAQEVNAAHDYNATVGADNAALRDQIKRFQEARSTLSKAQRDSQFAALRARHYHIVGLANYAVAHARAAIKLDAANPKAYYELCCGLYGADNLPEAAREIERLHARFPHFAEDFPTLEANLQKVLAAANSA